MVSARFVASSLTKIANAAGTTVTTTIPGQVRVSRFVDSQRVKFFAGNGGDGCISFLSMFANEFGGPDGGNGGNGGHVILRANKAIKSLNNIQSMYRASSGEHGQGKNLYGANADHLYVEVPIGTTVRPSKPKSVADVDYDPDKSEIIADLNEDGSLFIAARGGKGGQGNLTYLSNKNRHPRQAERGAIGEQHIYELRMRIYAHIGLIGMPNAGKSTLLKAMTGANVKIGQYAFTTLYPQVGTIEYDDYVQVAISDLPGLIEDSHKNRGLGVQFLRHVERCACIVYVIDLSSTNPTDQLDQLHYELESYKKGLSSRPHLVVGNKIDSPLAVENEKEFAEHIKTIWPNTPYISVSTMYGYNLGNLRSLIRNVYDEYYREHSNETNRLEW